MQKMISDNKRVFFERKVNEALQQGWKIVVGTLYYSGSVTENYMAIVENDEEPSPHYISR